MAFRKSRARPRPPGSIRSAAALAVALSAIAASLQGCSPAALLGQAIPFGIVAGSAIANENDTTAEGRVRIGQRTQAQMDLDRLYDRVTSAECADAESQLWLGDQMEHNGQVPPAYVEAYKWYLLAEAGDYEPAAERRAALGPSMTPAQIAEAEALAGAWTRRTEGCPEPQ